MIDYLAKSDEKPTLESTLGKWQFDYSARQGLTSFLSVARGLNVLTTGSALIPCWRRRRRGKKTTSFNLDAAMGAGIVGLASGHPLS
jgi:hypothetical protein